MSEVTTLTNCIFNNMWDYKNYELDNFTLSGIENLRHVTDLQILNLNKLTDISSLGACTTLENFTMYNTSVRNIDALNNLTSLKSLVLNNNRINDVYPLYNLKNLETLNLQNNALYDNSYDSTGKAYYTLTVFADLNQNQDGNLKNLYLSGNSIDDFSMLQDSNLKWDYKTGW